MTLRTLSIDHLVVTIIQYFNNFIESEGRSLAPCLLSGRTHLIMKNAQKGCVPNNDRPIACLSIIWKLFSNILSKAIYRHLKFNSLLPYERKGCYVNSRGTKDQLLMDKMLMLDAQWNHKNVNMAWIDFRKAYDSVPHNWLLKCLNLFGVHKSIKTHGSVSCGPRKRGVHKWSEYIDRNNKVLIFTHL